jgi:hypothetical protein
VLALWPQEAGAWRRVSVEGVGGVPITYEVLDGATKQKKTMDPHEIVEMCLRQMNIDYHFSFLLRHMGDPVVQEVRRGDGP